MKGIVSIFHQVGLKQEFHVEIDIVKQLYRSHRAHHHILVVLCSFSIEGGKGKLRTSAGITYVRVSLMYSKLVCGYLNQVGRIPGVNTTVNQDTASLSVHVIPILSGHLR